MIPLLCEFLLKTKTGIFPMKSVAASKGKRKYCGSANGISCTMTISDNGRYSASLKSDDGRRCISANGNSPTFFGIVSSVSDWIDTELWDAVASEIDAEYVETENGRIAYYGFNKHLRGTPIVFIHGGPGDSANTVKPRMMMIDRPVYSYDQLGCGNSDKIPDLENWNHENYFDELKQFIEKMNFERVTLIGASWGAGLAAGYAVKYGCSRIEQMVLISPFFSSKKWSDDQMRNLSELPEKDREKIQKYINGELGKKDCEDAISHYLSRFLFTRKSNGIIAEEAAKEEFNEVFRTLCSDNYFKITGNMKDFDIVPELGKISVPTLLMCGDSDEVRIDTLQSYGKAIENSRISVVPFAGHALSSEQFDIYSQTIRDFLREFD